MQRDPVGLIAERSDRSADIRVGIVAIIVAAMLVGCAGGSGRSGDTAALKSPEQNAPADWQPDRTPNHLALGRKLVSQGHYAVAKRQLTDARKDAPDDPEVHYLTGVCHRETGDPQAARTYFLKAIAMDDGYAPAYDGLGIACFQMNRPAEAREALEKALRLNPANADYHNNLGVLDIRQNRLDAARSRFEQCLSLDPGHARCVNNLAECLVRMGRDAEALARLQNHLSPAFAANNLGAVYLAMGRFEDARRMFIQALDHDPGLAAARHNLKQIENKEKSQP